MTPDTGPGRRNGALPAPPTRWPFIAISILAGLAAATQLGKVPPALPVIREQLGIGMVGAGWVASILNLMGATLGVAAGFAADRLGARTAIAGALALLGGGALAGAAADSLTGLVAARAVAGLGLLGVAVAAPRMIVASSAAGDRPLALGLWSVYVPAGFSLGLLAAEPLLRALGWRGLWLVNGILMTVLCLAFLRATRDFRPPPAVHSGLRLATVARQPGAWLLGACFGLYANQWFAVMTWLPTMLLESFRLSAALAAGISAGVIAVNVLGNVGGAWLLHFRVGRWWILWTAYTAMAACAVTIFSDTVAPGARIGAAFAFSGVGGLLPAAVLAATAVHAPSPQYVGTLNGFVVQGSHTGIVLGPPAMAVTVTALGGWDGAWMLPVAAGVLGSLLTVLLRRVELRIGR